MTALTFPEITPTGATVPDGAIRIGSDEHKRLFCKTLLDTFNPYRPAVIDWPKMLNTESSTTRSPAPACQLPPTSLSERNTRTPRAATATPAIEPRVSASWPCQCRISSVNTGPQARMSELENAVDQWMP